MWSRYDDASVQCPFFLHGKSAEINCEGIQDVKYTCLKFESADKKQAYKLKYCDRKYKDCEVCKALERKYD